jgi:hypothetical protein
MASYLQRQQGQQQVQQQAAPVTPITSAPTAPIAQNPVADVANFHGSDLPGGGSVNANSTSSGGGFGYGFADPQAAAGIASGLSNYYYSIPGGGYLHDRYPATATHREGEYYKGESHMMPGVSDPNANKAVGDIYAKLGALPRVANVTAASRAAGNGASPPAGPTINQTLQDAGINHPWGGPWEFPGWHVGG